VVGVILDTDIGDDIDNTWALVLLLKRVKNANCAGVRTDSSI